MPQLALWIGALTQGLAYAFLAWGVYLTFRVLKFADITVDGSFALGAAVTATLLARKTDPATAILAGMGAGAAAGLVTGLIHTRFGINDLLSGILTMTALYSINLHVMGRSNVSLLNSETVLTWLQKHPALAGMKLTEDWVALGLFLVLAVAFKLLLVWFLKTDLGMAMRATGDNPEMITAQGVNIHSMKLLGLALANALVGLAGGLVAQYQGFADVGMGIGSLVAGIAAVIIGETVVGRRGLPWLIAGVAIGSVLFRLLIAFALSRGLNPLDLKLVQAVFVFAALALPRLQLLARLRGLRKPIPAEARA